MSTPLKINMQPQALLVWVDAFPLPYGGEFRGDVFSKNDPEILLPEETCKDLTILMGFFFIKVKKLRNPEVLVTFFWVGLSILIMGDHGNIVGVMM